MQETQEQQVESQTDQIKRLAKEKIDKLTDQLSKLQESYDSRVLAHNTSAELLDKALERVKLLEERLAGYKEQKTHSKPVSVGVAGFKDKGELTWEQVHSSAIVEGKREVYKAKVNGGWLYESTRWHLSEATTHLVFVPSSAL